MNDIYRLVIEFPSGSILTETVSFLKFKDWIEKEKFGYKIVSCNGYRWFK